MRSLVLPWLHFWAFFPVSVISVCDPGLPDLRSLNLCLWPRPLPGIVYVSALPLIFLLCPLTIACVILPLSNKYILLHLDPLPLTSLYSCDQTESDAKFYFPQLGTAQGLLVFGAIFIIWFLCRPACSPLVNTTCMNRLAGLNRQWCRSRRWSSSAEAVLVHTIWVALSTSCCFCHTGFNITSCF